MKGDVLFLLAVSVASFGCESSKEKVRGVQPLQPVISARTGGSTGELDGLIKSQPYPYVSIQSFRVNSDTVNDLWGKVKGAYASRYLTAIALLGSSEDQRLMLDKLKSLYWAPLSPWFGDYTISLGIMSSRRLSHYEEVIGFLKDCANPSFLGVSNSGFKTELYHKATSCAIAVTYSLSSENVSYLQGLSSKDWAGVFNPDEINRYKLNTMTASMSLLRYLSYGVTMAEVFERVRDGDGHMGEAYMNDVSRAMERLGFTVDDLD